MNDIITYEVLPNRELRVKLRDGRERKATDAEWIAIWSRDPTLTLRLARTMH